MAEDKDLQKFLDKVDQVDGMIKGLNVDNEIARNEATKRVDQYLEKINGKNDGFNRTVINKKTSAPEQTFTESQMSQDDFMRSVERDVIERNKRKMESAESALVWKNKGNKHFSANDLLEAVKCYTEAIRLTPDNIVLYTNRAQVFIKLKNYKEALSDGETALKINETSIKAYVQIARALIGLNKFKEVEQTLNKILKIDKTQSKLVQAYVNEAIAAEQLYNEDEKVKILKSHGDQTVVAISTMIDELRKGCQSDASVMIQKLKKLNETITTDDHRVSFCNSGGFRTLHENIQLKRLLQGGEAAPAQHVFEILSLFNNVATGNVRNTTIVSSHRDVVSMAITHLYNTKDMSHTFKILRFIHCLSQFQISRQNVITSLNIETLVDTLFGLFGTGDDASLLAMGVVNNFALNASFIEKFQKKLASSFIPGIFKTMELLCVPLDSFPFKPPFLNVIETSVSTISNLFRDAKVREVKANDMSIWEIGCGVIGCYINAREPIKRKIVETILGMLVNLSTTETHLNKIVCSKLLHLLERLVHHESDLIVERCCAVFNHLVKSNNALCDVILNTDALTHFIYVVKGSNTHALKWLVKVLAVLTKDNGAVVKRLFEENALSHFVKLLQSRDPIVIGNTALCLTHCAENDAAVKSLLQSSLIVDLLTHAKSEILDKTIRLNCALALGKFAAVDQRCLELVRSLHGIEIIHHVLTINKLNGP